MKDRLIEHLVRNFDEKFNKKVHSINLDFSRADFYEFFCQIIHKINVCIPQHRRKISMIVQLNHYLSNCPAILTLTEDQVCLSLLLC